MLRKIALFVSLQEAGLCILSAILLILSFPDFNIEFLAWIGFLPLFLALKGKTKCKAFILAYISGFVFWLGVIYWLAHVTLAGLIVLALYLAVYFGLFGVIVSAVYPAKIPALLIIPSSWVLLEYARTHLLTGFPWALLGYSQYLNLPAIQLSDITGAWGVSFLVMLANVLIYNIKRMGKITVFACVSLILFCFVYGYFRIAQYSRLSQPENLKVSVVQANIPQEFKWDKAVQGYIVGKYRAITRQAASQAPDLIIWPEAASPYVLGEDEEFSDINNLGKEAGINILAGVLVREHGKYFNSAVLMDKAGRISARYDKLHLVPFGEYIPLKKTFPFLQSVAPIGDIERGEEYTIFQVPDKSRKQNFFGVLICFEDLFPELSRGFVKRGAQFLVNITNDAWYKKTSAPEQHFQASVFRAVENRLWLVRAANTGVSGFISGEGRIRYLVTGTEKEKIFTDGFKTENIPFGERMPSFYSRFGDIFIMACFLFVLYAIIRLQKNKP